MEGKTQEQQYYYKGFSSSIGDTHRWRTVEKCLKFMLPYVRSTDHVLDVGCGVGTITCDFGQYVPHGKVIGVEPTKEVLEEAVLLRDRQKKENVSFELASAYELPYKDNTFDIVFCHQVLVHLQDQVTALREMKRVVKPNGFICCKEADISSMVVSPTKYSEKIRAFFMKESVNLALGRSLKEKALASGFDAEHVDFSFDNYCTSKDEDRAVWSEMFIKRALTGNESIISDPETDKKIKEDFVACVKDWGSDKSAVVIINNGQLVYKNKKINNLEYV